jgi:hypothetical protein
MSCSNVQFAPLVHAHTLPRHRVRTHTHAHARFPDVFTRDSDSRYGRIIINATQTGPDVGPAKYGPYIAAADTMKHWLIYDFEGCVSSLF